MSKNKNEQATSFFLWLSQLSPRNMWVYTDGSRHEDDRAGADRVTMLAGSVVSHGSTACCRIVKVFDVKAAALRDRLADALYYPLQMYAHNLWACQDNAVIVQAVQNRPATTSSQQLI
jgi:hypothetical protein